MAYVSTANMQRKKSGRLKKKSGPGLTKLSKGYGKSKDIEDRRRKNTTVPRKGYNGSW